jgi:hypothetical protein
MWNKQIGLAASVNFSWEAHELNLLHTNKRTRQRGAQSVPIGMQLSVN